MAPRALVAGFFLLSGCWIFTINHELNCIRTQAVLIRACREHDDLAAIEAICDGANVSAALSPFERKVAELFGWTRTRYENLTCDGQFAPLYEAVRGPDGFMCVMSYCNYSDVLPDDPQLVCALLASGADVNAADPHGDTALHYAVQMHYDRTARILGCHGASRHVAAARPAGTRGNVHFGIWPGT